MSNEEDRKRAIQELADDVHAEDGWLSDAQYAQLEWDASMLAVRFCGEGSIDVDHMVSIVQAAHRTPTPAPDAQALIADARSRAESLRKMFPNDGEAWDDARLIEGLADALEAALGVNEQ